MKPLRTVLLLAAFLVAAEAATAANYYVRAGAAGANTGSDWNNAYTSLPSALARGNVYYVAAGSYGSYTFDDAESGTSVITIRKATAADHGTETGWQSSYGAGQAIFNSVLSFSRGYYVFDGQTRNENDWFDGNAYGFRINHNNQDQNIVISASNISVKYVFINAKYHNLPSGTGRQYAVDTESGGMKRGLLFHKMFVYGSNNIWFIRNTDGTIIEYSASDGAWGDGNNHAGVINLYFSVTNSITRYNIIRNAFVTNGGGSGGGTAIWCITRCGSTGLCGSSNGGHEIYGNLVYHYCSTDGVIGYINSDSVNNKVYNNTFVDGTGGSNNCWGAGVSLPAAGNVAYDNLWVGWQSGRLSMDVRTHDYNAFSGSSAFNEANAQTGLTTANFTSYAGGDFRLSADTRAGVALPPPYDSDLLGNLRGADGSWTRGAYEFAAGTPVPPVTHTVTPSAGPNGSISPSAPQVVNDGATKQFIVTPNTGFSASVGGTCGGSLSGTTYTTAAIIGDCTVSVTFTLITTATRPSPPPAVWVQ